MIPPYISPETPSNAEKRLFEALKAVELPDEYCCLHSVNLPDHLYKVAGELDFVIVGPRGLYVLEVKGGRVSVSNGIWSFTNRWGETNHKVEGPFAQAESGMYSLRNRLLALVPEYELSQLVMGYGVVFPDCDFNVHSVEWSAELVLDSQRLHSRGLLSYLKSLESYWHAKRHAAPNRTPPEVLKKVIQAMRPDFELSKSLQAEVDEIDARLVRLTEEQYSRLDIIEHNPRILVEGGAGTGKSFLASELARRHSAEGERVLFVCLSPALAKFLATQNRSYSNVTVISVHDLMLDVVRKYGSLPAGYKPGMDITDPWYKEQLATSFEQAAGHLSEGELFDVLIIDEAQDILNLEYLTALGRMLRGGLERGKWRIFYDTFNQGPIFGETDPDVLDLLTEYGQGNAKLHINCRNTNQIVMQTKMLTGADLGNKSTGPGPAVTIKTFRDETEAVSLLQAHLEELWNKQVPPSDITILSPRPYNQSSAYRLPDLWRKRITPLDALISLKFPTNGLTFSTIAWFKGLENRHIAVIDIDDLDSTPAARAMLYVGMSRARAVLWICMQEKLNARVQELTRQNYPGLMEDLKRDR
jgi:hypothetical protein